jgi:TIR domain
MAEGFDVLLSHNSRDMPVAQEIGRWLRAQNVRVWLDEWELRPGFPWQEGIEQGVKSSRAVAVLVGADGLGAWQEPEMRAFIARSRQECIPVIPVLLPGCPDSPPLTAFLQAFTWVDLRQGLSGEGLARLLWGIIGERPEVAIGPGEMPHVTCASQGVEARRPGGREGFVALSKRSWARRRRWSWGILLSALSVVGSLSAWRWPHLFEPTPPRPALYAVRVQIVDPQRHPVAGAAIRVSAGNEPHLLPDGWWQVEVPAAKVPADGWIMIRADDPDWEGRSVHLHLGAEPNPAVEIFLKQPETWLRGRVVDGSGRVLPKVRITRADGGAGMALTDRDGRFELKVTARVGAPLRVHGEADGWRPAEEFCHAGSESCSIVLEKS